MNIFELLKVAVLAEAASATRLTQLPPDYCFHERVEIPGAKPGVSVSARRAWHRINAPLNPTLIVEIS